MFYAALVDIVCGIENFRFYGAILVRMALSRLILTAMQRCSIYTVDMLR